MFCWTELGAEHVGIIQSLIVTCRIQGIDIDGLSYDELLDLNDRIIAPLKHLDAADTIDAMMKLTLGSKVCFDSGKHGIQVGTLIKLNQKTVSVLTEDGRRWKVSPQFLSPVIDEASSATNVIDLQKKK